MSEVKERPILFSTEMVQAILDGSKTETRRVINKRGFEWIHEDKFVHVEDPKDGVSEVWWDVIRGGPTDVTQEYEYLNCPYGKEGDLLYVRESFGWVKEEIIFKTSVRAQDVDRWKPSIHMPKEVSRIWLRVKEVTVEQVQEITEKGAIAEGIPVEEGTNHVIRKDDVNWGGAVPEFARLWNSINESRGYGWDKNPWVWVVKFEVISTNGRPV